MKPPLLLSGLMSRTTNTQGAVMDRSRPSNTCAAKCVMDRGGMRAFSVQRSSLMMTIWRMVGGGVVAIAFTMPASTTPPSTVTTVGAVVSSVGVVEEAIATALWKTPPASSASTHWVETRVKTMSERHFSPVTSPTVPLRRHRFVRALDNFYKGAQTGRSGDECSRRT